MNTNRFARNIARLAAGIALVLPFSAVAVAPAVAQPPSNGPTGGPQQAPSTYYVYQGGQPVNVTSRIDYGNGHVFLDSVHIGDVYGSYILDGSYNVVGYVIY